MSCTILWAGLLRRNKCRYLLNEPEVKEGERMKEVEEEDTLSSRRLFEETNMASW
ncbi:MAG: hypothetical protein ACLUOI_28735 [Eisenbergiella sp.]